MMTGFSELQVGGYRRLRQVELRLAPLNVLIGANGVGKSSVLDVVDLLAASAEGSLENTISEAGGISSLLTLDGRTDSLRLSLQQPTTGSAQPLKYELDISREGVGYGIRREQLTQQQNLLLPDPFKFIDSKAGHVFYHDPVGKSLIRPNWDYKATETALSQVPRMYQTPEKFRQLLASSSALYHSLDVSFRAPVRLPQPLQPANTPGNDGSDLLPCLYTMRETNRDRWEAVEDALRVAFPTFERLDFPPAAAGRLTLAWKDKDFTQPIYPHQLSEGTLRFLWLATLLQSPGLPAVTLIDEPEVSLHPEMLRLLAGLLREASGRAQLIVATHSDRFVRFLQPEELVVCDLAEDGGMLVRRASDLDLDGWLADYALDELWSMGRLGGRS